MRAGDTTGGRATRCGERFRTICRTRSLRRQPRSRAARPSTGSTTRSASFRGLAHRIELVGQHDGVQWFDDSKATTPNATAAAIRSFASVVLIAGGQNKGLDLGVLAREAPRIRAVVAIGEAAEEVEQSFAGVRPVVVARSMVDAVAQAAALARAGDAVLLSPACASFDWYKSYGERGDDFAARVRDLIGASR